LIQKGFEEINHPEACGSDSLGTGGSFLSVVIIALIIRLPMLFLNSRVHNLQEAVKYSCYKLITTTGIARPLHHDSLHSQPEATATTVWC
jgi:hypothetical protein